MKVVRKLKKILKKKGQALWKKVRRPQKEPITESCRDLVWAFNAGHDGTDFRGNPKYLFLYINEYRKDITAYWLNPDDETTAFVRSLGYRAYTMGTVEAEKAIDRTGVFVVEQVKNKVIKGMEHVKYLNLYHGVGAKDVEKAIRSGRLLRTLAVKYITNNAFYRNHQLFLCPSPMMEADFRRMCGIDEDQVVRAGYPRNLYQKYFRKVRTFDHDLRGRKGLTEEYDIAVYAPTFRSSGADAFAPAIPDMERLIDCCRENHILFVFKMHPLMEQEIGYLKAKERYEDCPYVWFWDNADDIYEIIDQIDLAVVDYSSIFTDFLNAGVRHFIRYVFDYEEAVQGLNHDYMEVTSGRLCYSFEELLHALKIYRASDDTADQERIDAMYWAYAGKDSFEKIIEKTMSFRPKTRVYPTLYSFDIFDTLISRKVLDPKGIFYGVQEEMKRSGLSFPESFVQNYPRYRALAERNVREWYDKTLEVRDSDRREIHMSEIFDRLREIFGLKQEQADFLMNAELEIEYENSVPIPEKIAQVKSLIHHGETVILISDMYLPEDFVKRLLEKADPTLSVLPLFLSSEYGVQKTTEKLYLTVYGSFEPSYDFEKWIHCGDNRFADFTVPQRLGIEARLLDRPDFKVYENALTRQICTYDAYLIAAMTARFRHTHLFQKEQFAYSYVSLYLVPYVCWALEDAVKRGFQTVYFISRDGYHLKRIADVVISEKHLPLKCKYIYGSRRAWRVPAFVDHIDEGFWKTYGNFAGVSTYEKLLGAMALDEETFLKLFPTLAYLKDTEKIQPEERWHLVEIFKRSEAYHHYLLDLAACKRETVCGYLAQEIDRTEKFAVIEYWGRGYTQESFTSLWDCVTGGNETTYFYYTRSILPTEGKNVRYNFTMSDRSQIFIESIFSNMPYKSIEEFAFRDGKYEPVIQKIPYDEELFSAMETYLVQFTKDYLAAEVCDRDRLNRDLFDFSLDYYAEHKEDEMFVRILSALVDSVETYGKKQEYAPAFTPQSLELMHQKTPRKQITKDPELSFRRSSEPIRQEYLELFQLDGAETLSGGHYASEDTIKKNRTYQEKTDLFFAEQIKKQVLYDDLATACEIENKILLMSDGASLPESVFRSLRIALSEQDLYQVREIAAKQFHDDRELLREIASARYIITAMPLAYLSRISLRDETETIVLNETAFSLIRKSYPNLKQKQYEAFRREMLISQIMISSDELVASAADYFHIRDASSYRIKGNCRSDLYFDKVYCLEARKKLEKKFPAARGKKVIVYLPMVRYRSTKSGYKYFMNLKYLRSRISDQYVVAVNVRLPRGEYTQDLNIDGFSRVMNGLMSMPQLLCAADVVVGDYRDTFFETPLLHKPAFMLTNDSYNFLKNRSTAFDFAEAQIGPTIRSEEELAEQLERIDFYDFTMQETFRKKYLTYCDGNSAKRVVDYIRMH